MRWKQTHLPTVRWDSLCENNGQPKRVVFRYANSLPVSQDSIFAFAHESINSALFLPVYSTITLTINVGDPAVDYSSILEATANDCSTQCAATASDMADLGPPVHDSQPA